MYSVLPALVSLLFLGYGLYVVVHRGFTRISTSFFVLCITTFFWQFTWAVLFQISDPALAMPLVKLGYLLILFLPTSLYQFLVELTGQETERRYVYLSYGIAASLALVLLGSDGFVDGYYTYFWGYYPKAGPLHPMHVIQTGVVVSRGLYLTYRKQQTAPPNFQKQLRLCLASLFVYFLAAIDYLCNYGIEFYPPGVVFITISLGIIAVAVVKYDLFSPMALATAVAHEMRTPLAALRFQAAALSHYWPVLFNGYQLAVQHGLCEPLIRNGKLDPLASLPQNMKKELDRSNKIIDMMLASASLENPGAIAFAKHSMNQCLNEALESFPFDRGAREAVVLSVADDFVFYGSDTLLACVFFNLLKDAMHAIGEAGKGEIRIATTQGSRYNRLSFTDTRAGVHKDRLPHIFETFFANQSHGNGIGLSFCRRVMEAFGGRIKWESHEGQYTTLMLEFPAVS